MKNDHNTNVLLLTNASRLLDSVVYERLKKVSYGQCDVLDIMQATAADVAKYDEVVLEVKLEYVAGERSAHYLASELMSVALWRDKTDPILICIDFNPERIDDRIAGLMKCAIKPLLKLNGLGRKCILSRVDNEEKNPKDVLQYLSSVCTPRSKFIACYTDNFEWVRNGFIGAILSSSSDQSIFETPIDKKETLPKLFHGIITRPNYTTTAADIRNGTASVKSQRVIFKSFDDEPNPIRAYRTVVSENGEIVIYLWIAPESKATSEFISQCDEFWVDLSCEKIPEDLDAENIMFFTTRGISGKQVIKDLLINMVDLNLLTISYNEKASPRFKIGYKEDK